MTSDTASVSERLVRDIGLWQADGLISAQTAAVLRERYNLPGFGIGQVMKYLGIIGLIFLVFGIFGLMAAAAGSQIGTGILLAGFAAAFLATGVRLALDKLGRYRWSSRMLLAVGALTLASAAGLLLHGFGLSDSRLIFALGLSLIPAIGALAYVYGINFLLIVALLGFFHWVGSWETMWGRSTYALEVQDPKVMALAALVVVGVGLWHERALRMQTGRFFAAYESLGLVYLNLSLLILSIDSPVMNSTAFTWVLLLTGVSLVEIIAGARLQNRLILGFGVTFTFINGFTRFYEHFWNSMAKGLFFLTGGVLTFAAGAVCEMLLRRMREEAR